ncbi:3-oxoadipate enol-lactonase [Variovorax boronicumulans]|uniref:3-oxoadipate enol-lactonase n=1 Tax=Variovorax boronicumulans TaxID=436515 RepID=UPI00339B9C2D
MFERAGAPAIHYTLDGKRGPWLVLSHSLGCDVSMWDAQMSALTGRYRVLRYDTRGHGRSGVGATPCTLEQLADDAAQLMDHLRIDEATWIGFSMGGMIGQTFALKYPQRVQGLVLADTTSQHGATPQSVWDERIRVARAHGIEPLVQPAIARWFTTSFRETQPAAVAAVAQVIASTSVEGWAGACAAIASVHTTSDLYRIGCPALVMVGEHDIGTPLAASLEMHRHLPQSTLAVIADAAHMTCIEQPERFNRALRMFLDSTVGASSEAARERL